MVQALQAEVETLKRKGIKKTSRNSRLPSAKGFKPNSDCPKSSQSHRTTGAVCLVSGRELNGPHDQVVVAKVSRCPHSGLEAERVSQQLKVAYERIELPRSRRQVARVERYSRQCPCCQQSHKAYVNVCLDPGSSFGHSIARVATYQQLSKLIEELYRVTISEGAIANFPQRVQRQLATPVSPGYGAPAEHTSSV